jgi:D-alanyl-lipoteichoic acid acyltransferase DltB (MBOAT superfamily)
MLFHTPEFLLFFVLFLMAYLPVRRTKWGVRVIVLFSSIFYASWNWHFLPLLWVTIIVDFTIGYVLARAGSLRPRRVLVAASVVCNLGILGYFKYWNFLVVSIAGNGEWAHRLTIGNIILPLGISFYVFQSMSYIIDVYRGKQPPITDIFEFAAFVTFFPHLIAGPIQRIQQLVPQIIRPDDITFRRVASGVLLFASGMLRKGLGDALAGYHDPIFKNLSAAAPADVTLAIFTFGLQIYLDFSGYSEMAVALARMLGIDLIQNFDAPYFATSIRDFWRRWHISLSLWLRDYLYISLGGNRYGRRRQIANLLFTMTVCGLWHGAGWNFVLWGLLHGIYLAVNTLFSGVSEALRSRYGRWRAPATLVSICLTYVAANYAWIYFRLATLKEALTANRQIWKFLTHPALPSAPRGVAVIFILVLAMDLFQQFRGEIFPFRAELTWGRAVFYGSICGLLYIGSFVLLAGVPTQQFIYFTF